jgi:hypothetical protein
VVLVAPAAFRLSAALHLLLVAARGALFHRGSFLGGTNQSGQKRHLPNNQQATTAHTSKKKRKAISG